MSNEAQGEAPEAAPTPHQAEPALEVAAAPEAPTPPAKLIKRYSNRKLYDTERSKYVTLDEIARMIKAGEEVTIIDNESKEDLTSVTLTQIIYEEEKRESRMPLGMLRNLIQTGGTTLQDFFDRSVKNPMAEMADTAQKSVEELRQSAAQIRDAATRSVSELTDSARRIFSREERKAEEFRRTVIALCDELEAKVAGRLAELEEPPGAAPDGKSTPPRPADAVQPEGAHLPEAGRGARVRAQVELLRERISRLEAQVVELERHETD